MIRFVGLAHCICAVLCPLLWGTAPGWATQDRSGLHDNAHDSPHTFWQQKYASGKIAAPPSGYTLFSPVHVQAPSTDGSINRTHVLGQVERLASGDHPFSPILWQLAEPFNTYASVSSSSSSDSKGEAPAPVRNGIAQIVPIVLVKEGVSSNKLSPITTALLADVKQGDHLTHLSAEFAETVSFAIPVNLTSGEVVELPKIPEDIAKMRSCINGVTSAADADGVRPASGGYPVVPLFMLSQNLASTGDLHELIAYTRRMFLSMRTQQHREDVDPWYTFSDPPIILDMITSQQVRELERKTSPLLELILPLFVVDTADSSS